MNKKIDISKNSAIGILNEMRKNKEVITFTKIIKKLESQKITINNSTLQKILHSEGYRSIKSTDINNNKFNIYIDQLDVINFLKSDEKKIKEAIKKFKVLDVDISKFSEKIDEIVISFSILNSHIFRYVGRFEKSQDVLFKLQITLLNPSNYTMITKYIQKYIDNKNLNVAILPNKIQTQILLISFEKLSLEKIDSYVCKIKNSLWSVSDSYNTEIDFNLEYKLPEGFSNINFPYIKDKERGAKSRFIDYVKNKYHS